MTTAGPIQAGQSFDHIKSGRTVAAVRGTLWSLVNSFAPAAFGIVVFMATSRVLVPAEFGLVAFAASIATLGAAIAPAGFGEALVQRIGLDRRHLDTVFWLCLGSGVVIYALIWLAAGPVAAQLGEPILAALIPFIGARVVFEMAAAVPNALLIRSMSFKRLAVRTTVASLVAAVGCLLLLWLGFGLWALAFSQLASAAVACVGAMISVRWWPHLSFSTNALKELSAFGLFASGNRFVNTLSVDQILIGTLLGPAGLGIYSFSRRVYQMLSDLITGALSNVSYSLLSSMQAEREKLREAYGFATFVSSAVSFPVFVGLAIIAHDFIPLAFGQNWTGAVVVVQAFCALGLLASIGVLQASLVKSQGQADLWFYYLIAKQVGTLLYVLLFHSWGIEALTIAIVIQNYVMWFPGAHMVARILKVPLVSYLASFALPTLATAIMSGVGLIIQSYLADADPLVRLPVTIAVCALVYTLVLLLFARSRVLQLKSIILHRG